MAFPVVQSRATGRTTTTNTTTHAITMPAGIVASDLLLVVFSVDGNPTVTAATGGWNKLGQASSSTTVTGAVFWRFAAGGDSLSLTTSATEQSSHVALRISNADAPTATSANGTTANSDPALHTPAGGAKDFLWVATRAADSTTTATAAPASYSNLQTLAAAGTQGASVNTAERSLNAASENPGTFTSAAVAWVTWTISVPPSLTQSVTMAAVASTATVGAPTLSQTGPPATVSPVLVAATPTVFAPTVPTFYPLTVASTSAVFAPTVPTFYPATVASTVAVGEPTIRYPSQELAPATVSSHRPLAPTPTLAPSGTLAPSAGADRVFGPTVIANLAALVPETVASTATVGAPTVTAGPVGLAPTLVASTAAVGAPTLNTLNRTLRPELVTTGGLPPSAGRAPSATLAPSTRLTTRRGLVTSPTLTTRGIGPTVGQPHVLAALLQTVTPAVVASTAVVGTPTIPVAPETVPSTATVGAPTVTAGLVTLTPTTVTTAFGTSDLCPSGGLYPGAGLHPNRVRVGLPTVQATVLIYPATIPAAATVYQPLVGVGLVVIAPQSVPSGADVLRPAVTAISYPTLVASTATVGAPALTTTTPIVRPDTVPSTVTVGAPTVTAGPVTVTPAAVIAASTVGAPTVGAMLTPTVVASTATVSAPTVTLTIHPATVTSSAGTVGNPSIAAGPVTIHPAAAVNFFFVPGPTIRVPIQPVTVPAGSVVHAPQITAGAVVVEVEFIDSGENVEEPIVLVDDRVLIRPTHVASTAAVGEPTLAAGPVTVNPASAVSTGAVGLPTVQATFALTVDTVPSTATVGEPTVDVGAPPRTVFPLTVASTAQVSRPVVAVDGDLVHIVHAGTPTVTAGIHGGRPVAAGTPLPGTPVPAGIRAGEPVLV